MEDKSYHVLNVTFLEDILLGHTFNDTADKTIGILLIMCLLIGLPGNIISLLYFWGRRKDSFPDILYTVISAVDACTCVLTLPVICSLMSGRQPLEFFLNYTICGLWYVPFYFTLRFSQFMVLVISVTRTITILAPFFTMKKRAVLVACAVYSLYILAVEIVFMGSGVTKFFYFPLIASSTTTNSVDPPDWQYTVFVMINLVNLILLSVIVFVSFVMSTTSLAKGSANGNNDFRRVSITITIFTAVFLVCNLPMFLTELLNNIFFVWVKSLKAGARESPFFMWYFMFISYRVLTPVNAALNPFLYLWRMRTFRGWILDHVRGFTKSKMGLKKSVPYREIAPVNDRRGTQISFILDKNKKIAVM